MSLAYLDVDAIPLSIAFFIAVLVIVYVDGWLNRREDERRRNRNRIRRKAGRW